MVSALLCGLVLLNKPASDFDHMLVIGTFVSGGRTPCPTDPIAYQMVEGTFRRPKVNEGVPTTGGAERKWTEAAVGTDGWITTRELNGGYAFASIESDREKVMVLDASGHSMVYVNGIPRGGDPYGFGFVQLPIELKKGRNDFLFSVGRGRVRAKLIEPVGKVTVTNLDPTFPDAIVGEDRELLCSVLVMNATNKDVIGTLSNSLEGGSGPQENFHITPLTVKKVVFRTAKFEPVSAGKLKLHVSVNVAKEGAASSEDFEIDSKLPSQTQRRTFQSKIDGSVQYYAVQPANQPGARALVLSLHGAGVEASGQAAAYGQKPWCNIVCPTNGRPYGYDWEDWGRLNALETLEEAKKVFQPDPDKVYLTGHSMGGHGTWSIGFNHPDKFAAIAPCAGWISFWSYAGAAEWKDPDAIESLLRRAANSSDTLKLLDNARSFGIFIQHGAADDNVPVEQAREMRKRLSEFHRDFDWHEEPGQSHWFDTDPEAGANVQDYAPLFDFLARHRLQNESDKRMWDVTVVNPDGTSRAANVGIVAQEKSLEPSRLEVRTYADGSYEEVKTTNVQVLSLGPLLGQSKFKAKVDGTDFEVSLNADHDSAADALFVKTGTSWKLQSEATNWKRIGLEGGIKSCFNNHVVGVYGTRGSTVERVWAYEKARFDAETWWYRGNGRLDLESDLDAARDLRPGQNTVYYGNPRTNSALDSCLGRLVSGSTTPFAEEAHTIVAGSHQFHGDLGLLWSGTPDGKSLIGVVGGTTLKGCRSVDRLPLFLSGVHFPDLFVNTPELYVTGSKGVVATGFYGPDWSVIRGELAFRG